MVEDPGAKQVGGTQARRLHNAGMAITRAPMAITCKGRLSDLLAITAVQSSVRHSNCIRRIRRDLEAVRPLSPNATD